MFSIDMGGRDIVLGVEWLYTLGTITMDFKKLTMGFQHDGKRYQFQGITTGSPEIINSQIMDKILKKVHSNIIVQFHAIQAVKTPSPAVHSDLQFILSKHQYVFDNLQGMPPSHGPHDHSIPLVPSSLPPNVLHYRHPFSQKS